MFKTFGHSFELAQEESGLTTHPGHLIVLYDGTYKDPRKFEVMTCSVFHYTMPRDTIWFDLSVVQVLGARLFERLMSWEKSGGVGNVGILVSDQHEETVYPLLVAGALCMWFEHTSPEDFVLEACKCAPSARHLVHALLSSLQHISSIPSRVRAREHGMESKAIVFHPEPEFYSPGRAINGRIPFPLSLCEACTQLQLGEKEAAEFYDEEMQARTRGEWSSGYFPEIFRQTGSLVFKHNCPEN